jgi:uncharacterized membrane protein (UPF0127 family)
VELIFHSQNGDHPFILELADTPAEQERGLMFRRSLGPNEGMLFSLSPTQEISFWMKNTLIPLDMIFVGRDSTIVKIATAKPLDETSIPSGEPVNMVIEIRGGRAAELGIRPGDSVSPPPLCCKPMVNERSPAPAGVNHGGPPMNSPPPLPTERGR